MNGSKVELRRCFGPEMGKCVMWGEVMLTFSKIVTYVDQHIKARIVFTMGGGVYCFHRGDVKIEV